MKKEVIRNGRKTKADNELDIWINVIKQTVNLIIVIKMIKLTVDNGVIKF
jgi:hypothetical protein